MCHRPRLLIYSSKVLIDTWWNVNKQDVTIFVMDEIGFNRYMVECEYRCVWGFSMVHQRFNRYMVECEFLHGLITLSSQPCVLIDTWWNVNKIDDIYISFRTLF